MEMVFFIYVQCILGMFESLPQDQLLQSNLLKRESLVANIVDLFSSIVVHLHIIFLLRIEILIYKIFNNQKVSQSEQKVRKIIHLNKSIYKVVLTSPAQELKKYLIQIKNFLSLIQDALFQTLEIMSPEYSFLMQGLHNFLNRIEKKQTAIKSVDLQEVVGIFFPTLDLSRLLFDPSKIQFNS